MATPGAWRNLTHDLRRLLLSLAGIGFVVLLMFMEMGFSNGCFDTATHGYTLFNADLVIINRISTPASPQRFLRDKLYLARRSPVVANVIPMYVQVGALWKIPGEAGMRRVRVFGYDTRQRPFWPSEFAPRGDLQQPGAVLFDSRSRALLGKPVPGTVTELNGRTISVVGLAPMGADLDTDGNLFLDQSTFFAIFGKGGKGRLTPQDVDYGLIQLRAGVDPKQAAEELRTLLPNDVRVLTLSDYCDDVQRYWSRNTAVGFLFNMGVVVGFLIGMIVCYQILFTDISNNLLPFATLKAMGYRTGYLVKLVLEQATFLALLGFVLGVSAAWFLYWIMESQTGLTMALTPLRIATILLLTLVMCLVAGLMALYRVIRIDPADCF
jgi:putative ABC transport system permease protein